MKPVKKGKAGKWIGAGLGAFFLICFILLKFTPFFQTHFELQYQLEIGTMLIASLTFYFLFFSETGKKKMRLEINAFIRTILRVLISFLIVWILFWLTVLKH